MSSPQGLSYLFQSFYNYFQGEISSGSILRAKIGRSAAGLPSYGFRLDPKYLCVKQFKTA